MENNARQKKNVKKFLLIVFALLIVLTALVCVLWLVGKLFSRGTKVPESLPSDAFYEADYSKNIFEYSAYQQLDRSIMYMEYDSGEILTEENYESAGIASSFFYSYFDAIIRGDAERYRSMLTENYINDFEPPKQFTMQMLYDIEVNRTQISWSEEYNGNPVTVYCFAVKYKIFENNGTFRNDIASNRSTTQYYELYLIDGIFYLNSYSNKLVIPAQ